MKDLLRSKKFQTTVTGFVAAMLALCIKQWIGFDISEEFLTGIIMGGFGIGTMSQAADDMKQKPAKIAAAAMMMSGEKGIRKPDEIVDAFASIL